MAKKEQSVQTNYDYYEMIQCLLNMPSYQQEINLLTMINIANHQQNDHSTLLYKQTAQLYPPSISNQDNKQHKHNMLSWRINNAR